MAHYDDDGWGMPAAGPSRARRDTAMDVDDPPLVARAADDEPARAPRRVDFRPPPPSAETPFEQLLRHWMNERHAPDVLHAQEGLLARLLDHIKKQTDDVALLRADPDSSEDEHFRIMLVQTEAERARFALRAYIRTRLHKIEKYARYIVETPEMRERLTQAELEHAQRYAALTESHFTRAVLDALPEEQRGLDDNVPFMPPMISRPDKTRAVFAHALVQCPPVHLPDGSSMEMERGQISLTPYHVIEQLLARGEVELV
ncbi:GINS complex Sld5 component [Phanerochaete sordida]|uniref:DNA replication complex GINS protein SLD5 n=1 Tax=Phanerochaete sordida TaxID=48140 RepID=A0A9P3LFT8_9APHY|nr:GINS complex Sld5 component [Phanerochaete sordida]